MQKALILEIKINYPTFKQIFDKANDLIETINITRPKRIEVKHVPTSDWRPAKGSLKESHAPTLNFATPAAVKYKQPVHNKRYPLHCRLCNLDGHSSRFCPKYKTYQSRVDRCKATNICINCTGNHKTEDCNGNNNKLFTTCITCQSHGHVSAMCKDRPIEQVKSLDGYACLSTSSDYDSPFLLPVISIMVKGPKGITFTFNALLDTCSSRSYFSSHVLNKLQCNLDYCSSV